MGIAVLLGFLSVAANEAVITNVYDAAEIRPKLPVESAMLYEPPGEWTYSHHPSLVFFKGRFYAMWSNGRRDEDAPGQRVLLASSDDFLHWTKPVALLGPVKGRHSELVLTAAGFHRHAGRLVAYVGKYEYSASHLDNGHRKEGDAAHECTGLLALTTTDGERWSKPRDLGLPIVPNHPPQALRSGRLVICGNVSYPYTDDPAGLREWRMSGIYPAEMAKSVFDDSEGFQRVQKRAGWPVGLCEGSFYQTDDGVIHMLLRSGTPRLWVTESTDDGEHWSAPKATEFSDNVAKFHLGRLPDGRFYCVGNPDPKGARNPLVLSLSTDGVRFDRHFILADEPRAAKFEGLYKGGVYGYPHSIVQGDDLCVIVSVCKESVLALRVPLKALADAR